MLSTRLCVTLLAPWMVAGFAGAVPVIAAQAAGESVSTANIESLIEAGRYVEAEALAQRAFDEASARGEDSRAGTVLLRTLVLNGRGAQPNAREVASRLVRVMRTSGTPSELATALRHLGSVLYKSGEYGDAVAALKETVSIRERLGSPSPELGDDLQQLVEALSDVLADNTVAGDAASPLADRLVGLRRAAGERVPLARALRARGVLRQNAGDYTRARGDLQESVSILEVALPNHPETALSLAHAGEQLQFEGALTQADQTLSRACAMAASTLRPDHPNIAECLRLHAQVREELGDFAGARVLRERGLAIARASLGEAHPRLAVQMNDLAINYQSQNDLSTARALLEQSRLAYTAKLGAMSNGTIVSSYNIALLDTQMGDYQEARREFERVVAAWTRTLGARHPNVARALSALAYVLAEQNLDLEARRLYVRALRIREQAYGVDHVYVGRTLSNLAASYDKLGDHQRALELSQRALRIVEKSGAPDDLAEALMTNAEILSRSGNQTGAAESHRRALAIRVELFGASHPTVATSQVAVAAAEARLGLSSQAFERALVGQRIGREHALLVLRSLPERQALEYANTRPRGLDLAISLAQTGDHRIPVLNEIILNRSLTLDEMGARRRIAADSDRGETKAVWDELALTRQRLANLIVRGPRGNRDDYTRLIDEARRLKESLERTLADQSASVQRE